MCYDEVLALHVLQPFWWLTIDDCNFRIAIGVVPQNVLAEKLHRVSVRMVGKRTNEDKPWRSANLHVEG
jgi:hypothetical protein